MNRNTSTIVKITVAILLILCLGNMPYAFYVLVRFVVASAFSLFSYEYFRAKREGLGIVFASLAILFQPFIKITLGRAIWNILDIIIAASLVYLIFKSHKK